MLPRLLTLPRHRSSSALLVRAWQNESATIPGQEGRIRYIFTKRNKMTFIPTKGHKLPTSPLLFAGLRQTSTAANESVSNPGPPAPAYPTSLLDIKIPYLSHSDPQPLVQIPYVPDFWDSSSPSLEPVSKETLPKILVVAGVGTHNGGGLSHNFLDISAESENSELGSVVADSSTSRPEEGGLWDDMADDIGLPPTKNVKDAIWKMFS